MKSKRILCIILILALLVPLTEATWIIPEDFTQTAGGNPTYVNLTRDNNVATAWGVGYCSPSSWINWSNPHGDYIDSVEAYNEWAIANLYVYTKDGYIAFYNVPRTTDWHTFYFPGIYNTTGFIKTTWCAPVPFGINVMEIRYGNYERDLRPPSANVTFHITETYNSSHNLNGAHIVISNGQSNTTITNGTTLISIVPNSSTYFFSVSKNGYYPVINRSLGSVGITGGFVNVSMISTLFPITNFTATPTSGPAPLTVNFTDMSTGNPTSWRWYFGDGSNVSTERNLTHTYTASGSYTVSHAATSSAGTVWLNRTAYVNVTGQVLVANFTATPTSGPAPLAVNFTDTSTGSPTSWSWSFGDGHSSPAQNPSHTYNSAGNFTVSLTVTNAGGSNATAMQNFIRVTDEMTTYYYYAESGDQLDYTNADWFSQTMQNNQPAANTQWVNANGAGYIDYLSAREKHWTSDAPNGIGKADIAFFGGHGQQNRILFNRTDTGYTYADAGRMNLGTGRLKWAVLDSCDSLKDTNWEEWTQAFRPGFHMLLGWNTSTTASSDDQGKVRGRAFTELIVGRYPENGTQKLKIIDAWEWAGKHTFAHHQNSTSFDIWNAAIYDTSCRDDYLPGWFPPGGGICSSPSGTFGYQSLLIFKKNSQSGLQFRSTSLTADGFSTTVSVPVTPESITVYKPVQTGYTKEWVRSLAKNLGMSGELRETPDAFYVAGTDAEQYYFEVRKDTSMISFQKFNARSGLPQPNAQSIAAASTFLRKNNLLPPDASEPQVVNNGGEIITKSGERHVDWKTNVVTYSQMIDGLPVYNAQFTIELDSNNNIIGLYKNWRDYSPSKKIILKSPEEAFNEMKFRQPRNKTTIQEKVNMVGISLGYSLQLSPDGEEYLEPEYLFDKSNPDEDFVESISITARKEGTPEGITPPTPTKKTVVELNATQNSTPKIILTDAIMQKLTAHETDSVFIPDSDHKEVSRIPYENSSIAVSNLTGIRIDNSTVSVNDTMNPNNQTAEALQGG